MSTSPMPAQQRRGLRRRRALRHYEPASSIGRTTATITGHIAEGGRGAITGCHFEYGLTNPTKSALFPVNRRAVRKRSRCHRDAHRLATETTYHYRLAASNAVDTIEGADRTITPHFVIQGATDPAINVSVQGAELAGSYVGDGNDTKYRFEYGTNEAYGQTTPEQDDGSKVGPRTLPPVVLAGLHTATTYHFRLVATNAFGTTYGQDRQFTTFGRPAIESIRHARDGDQRRATRATQPERRRYDISLRIWRHHQLWNQRPQSASGHRISLWQARGSCKPHRPSDRGDLSLPSCRRKFLRNVGDRN